MTGTQDKSTKRTPTPHSKKKLDLGSTGNKNRNKSPRPTPDSPMGEEKAYVTRSKTGSGSTSKPVIKNSTFNKTPSTSLLHASLLSRTPGLSPLARPFSSDSEQEFTYDSSGEQAETKRRANLSNCPCRLSTGGSSYYLKCSHCKQSWHTSCANLKGELTDKVVTSLEKTWQCPWCFVSIHPRPKNHKSSKLDSVLQSTSQANVVTSQVIESLESFVERKLNELSQPNTALMKAISEQLETLSKNIEEIKNVPLHSGNTHASHQPPEKIKTGNLDDISLNHKTKHVDLMHENYITVELEKDLMEFLENENFTTEGDRDVVQYGEHYRYMGSRTKPKPVPESIANIMQKLNAQFGSSHAESRFHYNLNSCLVNRYSDKSKSLPEHADNEPDIDPKSLILTLSLGSSRHLLFRDMHTREETRLLCKGRSLYGMSRHSQDFIKHSIVTEENTDQIPDGIRYSLTFRAIHWSHLNSTALIGDSNFGPIQLGSGKGKFGGATPGVRMWAPTTDKIDPLSCTSYRNVIVMVGTNDMKNKINDAQIKDVYKDYKTKICLIRKFNQKCRIFVCPVLPTETHDINRRINIFNSYLFNDLALSNLNVTIIKGFVNFLDKRTNLLRSDLSKHDNLHINSYGIRLLVRLIKEGLFSTKHSNTLNRSRRYSNTRPRGGPPRPP